MKRLKTSDLKRIEAGRYLLEAELEEKLDRVVALRVSIADPGTGYARTEVSVDGIRGLVDAYQLLAPLAGAEWPAVPPFGWAADKVKDWLARRLFELLGIPESELLKGV